MVINQILSGADRTIDQLKEGIELTNLALGELKKYKYTDNKDGIQIMDYRRITTTWSM